MVLAEVEMASNPPRPVPGLGPVDRPPLPEFSLINSTFYAGYFAVSNARLFVLGALLVVVLALSPLLVVLLADAARLSVELLKLAGMLSVAIVYSAVAWGIWFLALQVVRGEGRVRDTLAGFSSLWNRALPFGLYGLALYPLQLVQDSFSRRGGMAAELGLALLTALVLTKLIFVGASMVDAESGALAAMRASWRLSKGRFLRLYAIVASYELIFTGLTYALKSTGAVGWRWERPHFSQDPVVLLSFLGLGVVLLMIAWIAIVQACVSYEMLRAEAHHRDGFVPPT